MTIDELKVLFEVGRAHPYGLIPSAEYLPVAERLRERGPLVRQLDDDGEPNYFPSDDFSDKADALVEHQRDVANRARRN